MLCPLVRDGVPLLPAYSYFSSSPALSLRSFSSFCYLSSHASHHSCSLHCLSFVSSFSIPATVTFSALFHYAFPFPLGISLAFLAHPSAL